jgi:hypothetical protein
MTNQSIEDKGQLISLGEASERYGFSRTHFRQIAQRGRLKAQKIAGVWLTTPAAVEEYIKSRAKRGAYREDVKLDNMS